MPGFKSITLISSGLCKDWSQLPKGTPLRLSSWTSSSGRSIPFIQEETSASCVWKMDANGLYAENSISGIVRAEADIASFLDAASLMGRQVVAVVEDVDGNIRAYGSAGYPLVFSYEDVTEGLVHRCSFTVSGNTCHGAMPCVW